VVICLECGADLHMAHCHSLSLAPVKSRLVLPSWYWLTRVVPDKGPLNGCVCVCCAVREAVKWMLLIVLMAEANGDDCSKYVVLC